MHSITTRQPTSEEQKVILAGTRPGFATYGCMLAICVGGAWSFGIGGYWLGSFVSPNFATYVLWAIWAGFTVLAFAFLWQFIPYERKQRQLASRDFVAQAVHDIHVTDPRVVEIGLISNNAPILAFDIGGDTILFLQGQWLIHCGIYGVSDLPDNDEGDDVFNGLLPPHSFPSTEFTISRLPNSGEVLRIDVAGEYLAPESVVEALKPEYEFQMSEVFKGSLDDIASVLSHEHAIRTTRQSKQ